MVGCSIAINAALQFAEKSVASHNLDWSTSRGTKNYLAFTSYKTWQVAFGVLFVSRIHRGVSNSLISSPLPSEPCSIYEKFQHDFVVNLSSENSYEPTEQIHRELVVLRDILVRKYRDLKLNLFFCCE